MTQVNNRKARRAAAKNTGKITKMPKLEHDQKSELEELKEQYQKMIDDRDKKCDAAKEQLTTMLEITVDKYRTATGAAEALRILRFVKGEARAKITEACSLAEELAETAEAMYGKAKNLGCMEMDKLCDEFYIKDFVNEYQSDEYDEDHVEWMLAFDMMRIDLCRNVGGTAEDMVGFVNRTQEELNAISEKIDELEKEAEKEN